MPKKSRSLTTTSFFAAATGVAATGFFVATAPAQALPPLPLAPADCQQFAFSGATNIKLSTGPIITFNADGPGVNTTATDNRSDQGSIIGGIAPNRHVDLTFHSTAHPEDPEVHFIGDVGDDGRARGNFIAKVNGTWETPSPLACAQAALAAPKEGPTISFDPTLGGLVAHITDRSGTTSQCEYRSDFYTRTFRLEKNSTFDLKIVPAIPELRDRPIDITCDNGAETHTSTFF
jgi:hypothetical protein